MPTILITGTNKGLGLQFARKYAEDGWRVYAACRTPEMADDLNAIASASNGQVSVHKLDVLDFGAIDGLARELDGVALDILMNNAGIKGKEVQGFGQVDYDDWDKVFRTNVMSVEKMIEAFVEHVARGEAHRQYRLRYGQHRQQKGQDAAAAQRDLRLPLVQDGAQYADQMPGRRAGGPWHQRRRAGPGLGAYRPWRALRQILHRGEHRQLPSANRDLRHGTQRQIYSLRWQRTALLRQ